jgi:prepilin-type N-terminal cleavage/methylation domain-containing protein
MGKLQRNQSGFSAVELILVIVIVALISVVGWLVYKDHHKTMPAATTNTSTNKSVSSTGTTTATPNPYSGWKTNTSLGMTLEYPSNWTFQDNSSSNSSLPDANLTPPDSSNGEGLTVQDGPNEPGSFISNVITSTPLTFDGHPYYLVYGSNNTKYSAGTINFAALSTSSTSDTAPVASSSKDTAWLVSFEDDANTATTSTLSSNQYFQDAKLVIESVKY